MKFYNSLESLHANPPRYADPFILQWEIPNPKDNCTRKYIVFDGVSEYMKCYRDGRYTSCHEVFISSTYNTHDDISAHPVFDIDTTHDNIYNGWEKDFENDIISVLSKQYPNHQFTNIISFIWLTSHTSKKVSKHLVLNNICFSTWRLQMKILIDDLKKIDKTYISGIDDGIIRKCGSLRLPLNHKRHKYGDIDINGVYPIIERSPTLQFDNISHTFVDGIVMIHDANIHTMKNGIILQQCHLDSIYLTEYSYVANTHEYDIEYDEFTDSTEYDCITAFNRIDKLYDTGLKIGNIGKSYIQLNRYRSGVCPISGHTHDNDNAYLFYKNGKVYYGCHRKCSITINNKETKKYIDISIEDGKNSVSIAKYIHNNWKE